MPTFKRAYSTLINKFNQTHKGVGSRTSVMDKTIGTHFVFPCCLRPGVLWKAIRTCHSEQLYLGPRIVENCRLPSRLSADGWSVFFLFVIESGSVISKHVSLDNKYQDSLGRKMFLCYMVSHSRVLKGS